jgi:ABC-2 type transport system permease protein
MSKIWKIIQQEYIKHVFSKRFLFSLLSLPIAVVIMVGVALLVGIFSVDTTPVGYIDQSDLLADPIMLEDDGGIFDPRIDFISYDSEEQAKSDLEAEKIQAYYILPENYTETLQAELVYNEEPGGGVQSEFRNFIRRNLMNRQNLDPEIETRLYQGSEVTLLSLDGSREMHEDEWYTIFTPFVAGIMFVIVIMTSGGYLLQAVVEEKENRTMEIVITSVSPGQLMAGKIIGNISVGLTQLVIWLIFGWVGLKVGGQFFPFLQDFSISTEYAIVLLLVLLPSFAMVAAIMAAIGSTMTETREAQQVSGLFSLPIMIPYYLASPIMMNPNGTLAVALSYFPLTAPITILMRMAFTVVPVWQLAINIGILVIFAALAIWFAGRAFRLGMLQYGKKLSLKEVLRKRNSHE